MTDVQLGKGEGKGKDGGKNCPHYSSKGDGKRKAYLGSCWKCGNVTHKHHEFKVVEDDCGKGHEYVQSVWMLATVDVVRHCTFTMDYRRRFLVEPNIKTSRTTTTSDNNILEQW